MENSTSPKQKPLILSINNKNELHMSYMSFVKNGGLFVPTQHEHKYKMGEVISVLLSLMGEKDILITGQIIWKTPKDAENYRVSGIGIQFSSKDKGTTQAKIENHLAGLLESNEPTHTL